MESAEIEITDDLLASKGQRLIHHFIDLVPQYAFMYALSYGLFYLGELTGNYTLNDYWNGMTELEDWVFSYFIMFLYYFLLERYTFKTIGKFATNTMVVSTTGDLPTTKQVAIRTLCRWIPFDALSFLGVNGKGWHDSIPKTYVVKVKAYNAKKETAYELQQIGTIGQEF